MRVVEEQNEHVKLITERFAEYLEEKEYYKNILSIEKKDILLWVITYRAIAGTKVDAIITEVAPNPNDPDDFVISGDEVRRVVKHFRILLKHNKTFINVLLTAIRTAITEKKETPDVGIYYSYELNACIDIYIVVKDSVLTKSAHSIAELIEKRKEELYNEKEVED